MGKRRRVRRRGTRNAEFIPGQQATSSSTSRDGTTRLRGFPQDNDDMQGHSRSMLLESGPHDGTVNLRQERANTK